MELFEHLQEAAKAAQAAQVYAKAGHAQQTRIEEGQLMGKLLGNFLNNMSVSTTTFVETLAWNIHAYLLGQLVETIVLPFLIRFYLKGRMGWTNGENQWAWEIIKPMVEKLLENDRYYAAPDILGLLPLEAAELARAIEEAKQRAKH